MVVQLNCCSATSLIRICIRGIFYKNLIFMKYESKYFVLMTYVLDLRKFSCFNRKQSIV